MTQDKLELVTQHVSDLIEAGWSVSAISRESGVNQITLGNIKNRKAQRVTDKVYQRVADFRARVDAGAIDPPKRGRRTADPVAPQGAAVKREPATVTPAATAPAARRRSASKPAMTGSFISTDHVPVDAQQLQAVIDRLIDNFSAAIGELEQIRRQLKR